MISLNQIRRIAPRHIAVDLVLIVSSTFAALLIQIPHFKSVDLSLQPEIVVFYFLTIAALRVSCMIGFGCYSVMWRYISTVDALQLVKAIALSTTVGLVFSFGFLHLGLRLPFAIHITDTLFAIVSLLGARLYRRLLYEEQASRLTRSGKRTLVYGAGENGRLLVHRFRSDAYLGINVVGFIDDDEKKADLVIQGVPVLGNLSNLQHAIEKFGISQVIVAIPDLAGTILRELVMATRPFNIKPRIVPPAGDQNRGQIEVFREVELQDLLNRTPIKVDLQPVSEMMRGRSVLVTGAGGSIGSELARQIAVHEPSRLILLDNSEFGLYEIDRELRLSTHDVRRIVPALVDLKDTVSLRKILQEFKPDAVFHAAAYKHVHLVEANPHTAILNNIGGTHALVELSKEVGVKTFVMISTDKAVNPAGIMGATKRVCEMMVTAAGVETGLRYCSVRFGNVLGSSGSVIPLLQKQIQDGGPVTVTHPDMTRFFMLIPEAVSLVLKAASISKPGDINVLKMGDPVRILDIAKSLIALMGRAESEVPIIFTGLRPGEKMFEELYLSGDELQTAHPDILTIPNGDALSGNQEDLRILVSGVTNILEAAAHGTHRAIELLNDLVKSNYNPSFDENKDNGSLREFQTALNKKPIAFKLGSDVPKRVH